MANNPTGDEWREERHVEELFKKAKQRLRTAAAAERQTKFLKHEQTGAKRQNYVPCFLCAVSEPGDEYREDACIFEHTAIRKLEHNTEYNSPAAASPLKDPAKQPITEDGEYQQRHQPSFQ